MRHISSNIRGALVLLLAGGFSACAPVRLAAGSYSETRGPGVILLEGRTLRLVDNNAFTSVHWSDDMSSSRYGTGTYQLAGNKLQLRFAAPLPVVVQVRTQPLASPPDSLVLAFVVAGRPINSAAKAAVLPGATIIAYDDKSQVIAGTTSNEAGRAVLRLPRKVYRLRVQSLGFLSWQQECPASSTTYELELPINAGTPYAAGTVKELRLVRGQQSANALVVREGQRKTIFQRESPSQ